MRSGGLPFDYLWEVRAVVRVVASQLGQDVQADKLYQRRHRTPQSTEGLI